MDLINNYEPILKEKYNRVAVEKLNESSVDLSVWVWCTSRDYWKVFYSIQENIKTALEQNGISIPFNQLDVHLIPNESNAKEIIKK